MKNWEKKLRKEDRIWTNEVGEEVVGLTLQDLKDILIEERKQLLKQVEDEINGWRPKHEYCDAYKNHSRGDRGCLREKAKDEFAKKIIDKIKEL